jgi:type II restriction enzyme
MSQIQSLAAGDTSRSSLVRDLIERWRGDANATYRSWFLWEERIKNFRSIRRGIAQVVSEIEAGTFGVQYRGSPLETVVHSVAEQRQIFKGADHAFLWKPKLRIPNIYENADNQRAFARLLDNCACCNTAAEIVRHVRDIDRLKIKGLGPAVANLLYFLHPTHVPPFNTAIVKGYNELTGSNVKLGSWEHFLAMREGVLDLNTRYRDLLSNDLGAIGGLLFDIGSGRYPAPPLDDDQSEFEKWSSRLERARVEAQALSKAALTAKEDDRTHTEIQSWIRDLGLALGYDVWIASNDRGRLHNGSPLGSGNFAHLAQHGCWRGLHSAYRRALA